MKAGIKLVAAVGLAMVALASRAAAAELDCHVAVYRLNDGTLVDIAPEDGGLRWRTIAGRTGRLTLAADGHWQSFLGWTNHPDSTSITFGPCGSGAITLGGKKGQAVSLNASDTAFRAGGVELRGRLVLPRGSGPVPIMIVGHGSERTSALTNAFRQRLYPAAGVGVFVYDKRGTGQSGGKYTQDFDVLASDAAAAMAEARRLAGKRASRVGFQGGSQAGWVLPLAAQKTPADYVIIGYGIAASPLIEDRTETMQDLVAKGWGPEVLAKAGEVTDATATVISSRFTRGFEQLRAVVGKYGKEPWFKDLKGEFTGEIVKYPEEILRAEGPKRDDGTTWAFDAVASLRKLGAPLLWMIAAEDSEGAGPETKENLITLHGEGRPVTIATFPGTEHGIHIIRKSADGKREQIGYSPGYFAMELEFARTGRLARRYPGVEIIRAGR